MVICPSAIIFLSNFVKKVGEVLNLGVMRNEAATTIKANETTTKSLY